MHTGALLPIIAVHIPAYSSNASFSLNTGSICAGFAVGILVSAIICYFLSDALAAVAVQNRQNITPGQVWLLLIPIFGLVWNFFVYQRTALSFQSYFEGNNRPQPGDYGKQMSLIYSILSACSIVPCVGILTGLASLVLVILLLVKFQGYKKLIVSGGGTGFQVLPPKQPPQ